MELEYTYLDCIAEFGVGGAHPGGLQLTKNVLSKENIEERTKVLDVGCGTGQTSAYIAEQYGCCVTSLDCNTIMLEKAKQRFQSLHLPIDVRYGNTENLPFDDGLFDIVLSESVTAFTDASVAIPEYRRVLRPGGVLLAIEMTLEKTIPEEQMTPILEFYGVPQLLTEKEWYNLFNKAGFNRISVEKYKLPMDEHDVQNPVDFSFSENIKVKHFEILTMHGYFTSAYKDILGCRIFRCVV